MTLPGWTVCGNGSDGAQQDLHDRQTVHNMFAIGEYSHKWELAWYKHIVSLMPTTHKSTKFSSL